MSIHCQICEREISAGGRASSGLIRRRAATEQKECIGSPRDVAAQHAYRVSPGVSRVGSCSGTVTRRPCFQSGWVARHASKALLSEDPPVGMGTQVRRNLLGLRSCPPSPPRFSPPRWTPSPCATGSARTAQTKRPRLARGHEQLGVAVLTDVIFTSLRRGARLRRRETDHRRGVPAPGV